MKQHPIPQNILDIEFKLFTKFTVREFVYMAIGIGFGGIFLYFFTKGQLPGIIAIPIFIASSAVGLFLGLVPINDQQADIFLRNYIVAITNPTQRVWRNQTDDQGLNKEVIKDQMQMTKGTMQRGYNEPGTAKIVGAETLPETQFVLNAVTEQLDKEEEQRLASIGVHSIPGVQTSIVTGQPVNREPISVSSPVVEDRQVTSSPVVSPEVTPSPQLTQDTAKVLISRDNLAGLQIVETPNIPLGINLRNTSEQPIGAAIVAIKDESGKILFAQRTDSTGSIGINRLLPAGRYSIIVQTKQKLYNHIQLLSDGKPFPTIKILLNE